MPRHRWQPTRPRSPWGSLGKNTGVGCHFLLLCMKVKMKSLSGVRRLATPWTAAYQAPPSLGFSRSGVPLPAVCRALTTPLKHFHRSSLSTSALVSLGSGSVWAHSQ